MTKSYTVKGANILHNKKTYGIGSTIDLADDEAKKIADYITPIKAKPQSTPPAATGDTGTTTKKSNKKSDKSLNTSDSSDSSTTTTDITPIADTNAVSSNAESVSAEDAVSGAAKQETTNDETVQTTTN